MRSAITIVGTVVCLLAGMTAVVYFLTQWEKQKALAREVVKPELTTKIALHEVAADMPIIYTADVFLPQEFVKAELVELPDEAAVVAAVTGGQAEFGVVDVHHAAADSNLRIVAPVSYVYLCGNAFDPSIPEFENVSAVGPYDLSTNLPEGSLYLEYLRRRLPNREIRRIEIRDGNQIEWRAVIRQPANEVFFGTQPYCSQYEKYADTRKDDRGRVFSMREAHDDLKTKLPARVLVTTAETAKSRGELIFRLRSALSSAAENAYRVPTKLESATFYRYQTRVSPEGYSLGFDWEMAYRVARSLTEGEVFPRKDEVWAADPAGVAAILSLVGRETSETEAKQMVLSDEVENAIEVAHAAAEENYSFRYLTDEEVQEKLRLAEAESGGAEWEKEFELTGEAKPIERLYDGPIRDNLYGVDFVNENTGWFVGSYGTIVVTRDGGKTFEPQDSGVQELLKSVYFVDEKRGWVSGVDGTILHTKDGGTTWTPQVTNTQEYLRSIVFLDENKGFAGARISTLLVTDDGGETWNSRPIREKRDDRINRIRSIGGALWVVGEFGGLFVSRDQGATWEEKPSGTKLTLTDIAFLNERIGMIAGIGGAVVMSANAGETWAPVDIDKTANLFGLAVLPETGAIVAGKQLLLEVDLDPGKGATVESVPIGGLDLKNAVRWLYTLTAAGDSTLWGVGEVGTVVVSRDSGRSWSSIPLNVHTDSETPARS